MSRVRIFAVVAVACVLASAAAIASAVRQAGPGHTSVGVADALGSAREADRPMILFRSLATASRDQVGIAPVADPGAAKLSSLRCERVYFNAGVGLCVARGSGFAAGYRAEVFGPDLRVRHTLDLEGIPSRARVSRDGRYGSVTMFVSGHSYVSDGTFSTQTTLIDLRSGEAIGDLEDFTVSRRGRVITAEDVNFWGTTFAPDGDHFYATLATGGRTYLVRGSIRDRTMRTLHENVECPSLSPDGTRIAYKKRVGSRDLPWRLAVLDLATMRETLLSEARGIDDQAEWLDDQRVLYGLDGEIRVVAADGSGEPRRFRAAADSPAVVRWSVEADGASTR
jgi:hypothetical protein